MRPIRVVLVDDHALFRAGVASALGQAAGARGADVPASDLSARDGRDGIDLTDGHIGIHTPDSRSAIDTPDARPGIHTPDSRSAIDTPDARPGIHTPNGRSGIDTADARSGIDIVGEADDIASAVAEIRRTEPDVVLLDVHLTSGSGVEVIVACSDLDAVQFLALSVSDAPEDVLALVRAGARGYVTKRIDGADLVDAIARVAGGDAVFSPRLAGFVLDAFARSEPGPAAADAMAVTGSPVDADLDRLSPREQEVMRSLARGYAYKEIAREMGISIRTVESHTSSVLRKLQLSNRHELTHWAAHRRLV